MMKFCVAFIALVAVAEAYIDIEGRLRQFMDKVEQNATLKQMYEDHLKQFALDLERHEKMNKNRAANDFTCLYGYNKTTEKATSVHNLRPEQVNVIAAMGDSLTAGNGIIGTVITDCLTEYRGRSWSIGGDNNFAQGVETLPNILKYYNHDLHGYSLGKCDETVYSCSQLNVAKAGATSADLPRQATDLVNRLRNPAFGVDMDNEWKVITLFIGGNDLCDACTDGARISPEQYQFNLQTALDILHANVPRAYVNVAQIFDITPLSNVIRTSFMCQLVVGSVCPCGSKAGTEAVLQNTSMEYQVVTERLIEGGRYDTRDDFTVVMQPFFKNTVPVRKPDNSYDMAYFAPDCFHFSYLGANAAGKSLWNNMIEPVGDKQDSWHLNDNFHCPHTHGPKAGVFQTYLNKAGQ